MSRASLIPVSALFMGLNFTVSVLIIWVNKFCYRNGFRWNTSLTTLHFLFTFVGLHIAAKLFGLFKFPPPGKLGLLRVLPISLAFIGFVVFNNLSLQYNAVGVYQLLKVLTTPVVVFLGVALNAQKIPREQILALVPTCIGVILATVTHLEANFWGLFWGALGIISTSLYQVWVKSEQAALGVTAPQLLHAQSFVSFFMLLVVSFFLEDVYGTEDSLLSFNWLDPNAPAYRTKSAFTLSLEPLLGPNSIGGKKFPTLAFMVSPPGQLIVMTTLSAVLAFLVNLSIFLVIGRTDPVSYNVLGHAKLCCILVSGYVLFGETATAKNLAGVAMAVCGIVTYTHLKISEADANKKAGVSLKNPLSEPDSKKVK